MIAKLPMRARGGVGHGGLYSGEPRGVLTPPLPPGLDGAPTVPLTACDRAMTGDDGPAMRPRLPRDALRYPADASAGRERNHAGGVVAGLTAHDRAMMADDRPAMPPRLPRDALRYPADAPAGPEKTLRWRCSGRDIRISSF